jgi:uncharacterized protein (TIGR03437 family)
MSNTLIVGTLTATPAILAVVRPNGSVVSAGNAPVAGENLVVYALGLGAVTPDVAIGGSPTPGTLAFTVVTPQLTIGSAPLTISFSGLVSGFVGLYQVNAQMPASLPPGSSGQLVLSSGSQTASIQLALK